MANSGRRFVKRVLNKGVLPFLRPYAMVKAPTRFTDEAAALDLLAPLMTDAETADYHRNHLQRYFVTLELLKDLPRSTAVLEVGAPPYGLSILMKHWLFDQVSVTGYAEKSHDQYQTVSAAHVTIDRDDGTPVFDALEQRFNLELHRWPFADEQFDLVIACETFEHLGLDPMHAYGEANRVLRTGGRLFLTVPNGMALSNGLRYFHGRQPNSFPFYRPEGFSLRHQREPTPDEVETLFAASGFDVEFVDTLNISRPDIEAENPLYLLGLAVMARPLHRRRELLVARGIKRRGVQDRFPVGEDLYYHWDVR